jgi:hypothetical protein
MNSKELGDAIFGRNYCNQEIYIVEAFFANPHKYSDAIRDEIYHHVLRCERCKEVFYKAEKEYKEMEKWMRD